MNSFLETVGLEAAVLAAAFAAGVLLEKAVRRLLARRLGPQPTRWRKWLVTEAFRWTPSLLLVVAGLHLFRLLRPQAAEVPFITGVSEILLLLVGIRVAVDVVLASLELRQERFGRPAVSILRNIVITLAAITAALVVLESAGVSIGPVLATLGVGALALALALQPALGNLFAGVQIMAAGRVRVGDFIRLAGSEELEGYVTDIGWRSTTLRTLLNNAVIIPNSRLAETLLTNLNAPDPTVRLRIPVGVHYSSDLDEVDRIVREVIRTIQDTSPALVPGFPGDVRWTEFGDSAVIFEAIVQARRPQDRFDAASAFIRTVHRRFDAEGIEIPFPIRNLYLRGPAREFVSGGRAEPVEGSRGPAEAGGNAVSGSAAPR